MKKYGKWIAGGLGWAFMGPIGGILGFIFGSLYDSMQQGENQYTQTQGGDFSLSLLVLAAAVIKADGKILKSELDFVKNYFIKIFGEENTEEKMQILSEILKQDIPVQDVCLQIKQYMEYESRLQLLHFLLGISNADDDIDPRELKVIFHISNMLGIDEKDYESVKAMFVKVVFGAYRVLEIRPDVTDEEIKKAYRSMAIKYHPDKVTYLGEEIQNAAKIKFQQLNAAYEEIKKQRGIK